MCTVQQNPGPSTRASNSLSEISFLIPLFSWHPAKGQIAETEANINSLNKKAQHLKFPIEGMKEALEFHGPAFGILGIEMIDSVLGILLGWRLGFVFEFLIHPVHTLFFGVEKGESAFCIGLFSFAKSQK